jgi:hypothetical protein
MQNSQDARLEAVAMRWVRCRMNPKNPRVARIEPRRDHRAERGSKSVVTFGAIDRQAMANAV